jgi:hypothetical protein
MTQITVTNFEEKKAWDLIVERSDSELSYYSILNVLILGAYHSRMERSNHDYQ